jgi:RNase P/RNase MRP subunit POP5
MKRSVKYITTPAPCAEALGSYQSGQVNVTLCLAKTRNVTILIACDRSARRQLQ